MPTYTLSITGRVAYVVGGASGIGAAIAYALLDAGISVGIIDRNSVGPSAKATSTGARRATFKADVSQAIEVGRVIEEARAELGNPDYLIHCPGIYPRSRVEDMDEAEWDRVLDTNLKSAFLMFRGLIPWLSASPAGRILAITSELGSSGVASGSHYAASKAGLSALVRSCAKEVADRSLTVNAIAPGLTDTPMMRGANDEAYIASVAARQPGGRLGQPGDVVGLVMYLLSDAGALVTGQVLNFR